MQKLSITAAAVIMICTVLTGCSSSGRTTGSPGDDTLSGGWKLIVNPEISGFDRTDTSQKVYYTFSEPGQYNTATVNIRRSLTAVLKTVHTSCQKRAENALSI